MEASKFLNGIQELKRQNNGKKMRRKEKTDNFNYS